MTMPTDLERPTISTDPVADARQRMITRISGMFEDSIRMEYEISISADASPDLRSRAKDHLSRTRSLLAAVQQLGR